MRLAKRVQDLPPYLFAELERKIAERKAAGIDVISLGIGDPDLPTPDVVVAEAQRQVALPDTHQYPSNRGRPRFREAVATFYQRRFGVDPRPRHRDPAAAGRQGGRRPRVLVDARPRRHLPGRRSRLSRVHRLDHAGRRRAGADAAAGREPVPARPGGVWPATSPIAPICSSATTRTTPPARSSRTTSSSAWPASDSIGECRSCTTTPTRS